ncbi:ABC-F family ATP-binding cassette domain-containing protein [Candidatus Gracilibacteria bacterium]|nr:ABC-F family ATP-binding cassette domain-containing protein [Candidatus Gracilibacteria bacterium]
MSKGDVVIRFDEVTYGYVAPKWLLDEVNFSVREGSKITLMGQNGAGKSTIFKMITGEYKPNEGRILITQGKHIAIAKQVMSHDDKLLTLGSYFRKYSRSDAHNIDRDIKDVLDAVDFMPSPPPGSALTKEQVFANFLERTIGSFSGGQQARLLLSGALIQNPDILLLDEPTNNLDTAGIWNMTAFLQSYEGTVLVISHDAEFLNSFTDGILYLDVFTRKIEQFVGDYHDAVEQVERSIEAQNRENARLEKEIQANKDQANVFAHKGGKLRAVAKKMVEKAEELEASKGDVRREDKTIRDFKIPNQEGIGGQIIQISSLQIIKNHEPVEKEVAVSLGKNRHLLLSGPNGIGKSTLLESIAKGTAKGVKIGDNVKIGYYRQDFSTLDFSQTVYDCLFEASDRKALDKDLRSFASGFLITGELMATHIGALSEGQKGLVMFAKLALEKPGLLILDEPTNHINFRHLPIIAKTLDEYEGTMIMVSHIDEFVWQVRIDEYLELE